MKLPFAAVAFVSILVFAIPSAACSIHCIDRGVELASSFRVEITHGGKPLVGVSVQVIRVAEGKIETVFSGVTAPNGTIGVESLPPGDYSLSTELLGISAGGEWCFHVEERPSRLSHTLLRYQWGDFAPETRQIRGKLIDSRGEGDRLLSILNPSSIPISGATLKLQNPLTGAVVGVVSDPDGSFSFLSMPNGVYVLRVEGGRAGTRESDESDSADILIRVNNGATQSTLVLTRLALCGCGSCTDLKLQT